MRLATIDVLQTSAMDCGPAAVASVLASHGRGIDLPRLREACQTDLDGTSIDVMAEVLQREGLPARQIMVPADRLADHLPALAVVRLPDGAPHFVNVWRVVGPFVQVMDPARGGSWRRLSAFLPHLLRHRHVVDAGDWCDWARGAENVAALRRKAARIGVPEAEVDAAAAAEGWFPLAALEACLSLAADLPVAVDRGRLALAMLAETRGAEEDIFRLAPPGFWPVLPDPANRRGEPLRLILQGAVLVSVRGGQTLRARGAGAHPTRRASLLAACLATGWALPGMLLLGTLVAVGGSVAEALAFRALIDPALGGMPIPAMLMLLGAMLALRLALGAGVLGLGRRVEMRYRRAGLAKLLRLPDRWNASRPLGDLAERAQSLFQLRHLPGQIMHLVQSVAEVAAVSVGLILIAPASGPLVLALAGVALVWPFAFAPLVRQQEMTLRGLNAAQAGVLMDALRGRAALAAHRAGASLSARQDALLSDWAGTARNRSVTVAFAGAAGQAAILCLVAALIFGGPADLLFLWWVMKLPGAAQDLGAILRGLPAQEATLARIEEPLRAPDRPVSDLPDDLRRATALAIDLHGACAVAGGHVVLDGVDLTVAAGEHVAIVGASGSGKSSLIGVLMGWHELSDGELRIGGLPVGPGGLAALRERVVWIDPTTRLWGDTVAEAATDGNLPRRAGLNLPAETRIGRGGALLSAGEGQRLRIARALAAQAPGLILCDEALRGLDRERRTALLAMLRAEWAGRTLIWVTHDLTEAAGFGRVVVMAEGRVVETGAPAVLASAGGPFAAALAEERALDRRYAAAWERVSVEDFRVQPAA